MMCKLNGFERTQKILLLILMTKCTVCKYVSRILQSILEFSLQFMRAFLSDSDSKIRVKKCL
jgi:hypothetical protein